MKKAIFIIIPVLALFIFTLVLSNDSLPVSFSSKKTVIIDPGHGYPDGGAVASDGTAESELNLAISLKIKAKLENAGVKCILTRADENSIYTEGNTIHAKKVSDIRNRVKLATTHADALVLSVHMNTFPSSDVSGAQFFYKKDSEFSKQVAEELQNSINIKFQPDNTKTAKSISKNIYFLNNITNDCILAECGFLTNAAELDKLKSSEFQDEISTTIAEVLIYKISGSD